MMADKESLQSTLPPVAKKRLDISLELTPKATIRNVIPVSKVESRTYVAFIGGATQRYVSPLEIIDACRLVIGTEGMAST